jgi:hypothetical protein
MKKHKLDPKHQKSVIISEIQTEIMENVNQDIEDL